MLFRFFWILPAPRQLREARFHLPALRMGLRQALVRLFRGVGFARQREQIREHHPGFERRRRLDIRLFRRLFQLHVKQHATEFRPVHVLFEVLLHLCRSLRISLPKSRTGRQSGRQRHQQFVELCPVRIGEEQHVHQRPAFRVEDARPGLLVIVG